MNTDNSDVAAPGSSQQSEITNNVIVSADLQCMATN
jgi:hypothetical protein